LGKYFFFENVLKFFEIFFFLIRGYFWFKEWFCANAPFLFPYPPSSLSLPTLSKKRI
jgi:hypothetical protein